MVAYIGSPEDHIQWQDDHPTTLGMYSVKGSPPTTDVKLLSCPLYLHYGEILFQKGKKTTPHIILSILLEHLFLPPHLPFYSSF